MIVLDTHALIWSLSEPELLSKKAKQAIAQAREEAAIYISAFTIWEIALLVKKKRLRLTLPLREWISQVLSLPYLTCIDITAAIALDSVLLPQLAHTDPADKLIITTALQLKSPLVTKDRKIRKYQLIETIW